MGQVGTKTIWPKPTRAYQTVMRRRYGRRHVGFRPVLDSQDRDAHEHSAGCKRLKSEDVQKENSTSFSESSRSVVQVSAALLDEPLSENAETREPTCQNELSQTSKANTPPLSTVCNGPEGNQVSQNFMNPYENSENFAEGCNDLNGKDGIGFVNIDSYEPDSSDGEDDAQDKYAWLREATAGIQGQLGNLICHCEEKVESFTDLQPQLCGLNHGVSRESYEEAGSMPFVCPNNRAFKSTEDQAVPKINVSGTSYKTQQVEYLVDVGVGFPVPVTDVLNVSDGKTDQVDSSEPVVRPKIRNENTTNQLKREVHLSDDDEEESGCWKFQIADVQQCHPQCPLRDREEMTSGSLFLPRVYSDQKNAEDHLIKNAAVQKQKNGLGDSTFWDDLENCNRHCFMSHKNENSSECSDGECTMAVPVCFTATEQEQSSSDESWETVPFKEEFEVPCSNSDVKDEITNLYLHEGEEGEILCLQYREEGESSSDEEDSILNDFIHSGFFLLNENNIEDDSSISEDLDVDWRVLEEFADGLGLDQNIPYAEPQLLTFMALEGRLEAVETALAQLESLAFEVEQTYPPAAKETIDCLPMVPVTGQDQSCTICCSEYGKGEYVAELPCHHLFHKSCVARWLQRSGTCPICRHVLAPVSPEAAAGTCH